MSGRFVTGNSYFDIEKALFNELDRLGEIDPFGERHVLVGSNLQALYLRRKYAAARGGTFNLNFITFPDLVRLIETRKGGLKAPPLPPFADLAVAADLLAAGGSAGIFEGMEGSKGLPEALLDTFTDLAEGCCGREDSLLLAGLSRESRMPERVAWILSLYASFRERIEASGWDIHTRFKEAGTAVPSRITSSPLLVYGFYDFNGEQWRLLKALEGACGTFLFVPRGGERGLRFAGRLEEKLEGDGYERQPAAVVNDKALTWAARVSAHDAEEEIRETARKIIDLVRGAGFVFSETAVLPVSEEYIPLICEILEEAGIPAQIDRKVRRRMTLEGASAIRLLDIIGKRPSPDEIVDFIVSAPFVSGGGDGAGRGLCALWAHRCTAAEIGIGTGASVAGVSRGEKVPGGPRGSGGGGAGGEAGFVGSILDLIGSAADNARKGGRWSELVGIYGSLLTSLFGDTEGMRPIISAVEELAGLDRVSGWASIETFSMILGRVLASPGANDPGAEEGGVRILTPGRARGIGFRAVFIPGLTDSAFPGKTGQDPLLKDDERRKLGHLSNGKVSLPAKSERSAERALLLSLASSSAEEVLVLSYPRIQPGSGRESIPSPFLEMISERGGYEAARGYEDIRMPRPNGGPGADRFLSAAEYDFQRCGGGGPGANYHPGPFFFRGLRASFSRFGGDRFTPYDGVFESKKGLDELGRLLDGRGWCFSSTEMERWARCPFAYFLESILGLDMSPAQEPGLSLSPLKRGTLVHAILEKIYEDLASEGLLPVSSSPPEKVLESAGAVIDRSLSSFEKEENVGIPLLWEIERKSITRSLRLFLEEEMNEEEVFVPLLFERVFGGGGHPPVDFRAGDRKISFRGRIDRIDGGAGSSFRVIDYKTGGLRGKDNDIGGGENLQLPVYLLAASAIMGRPLSKGTASYRKIGVGTGRGRIDFSGGIWEEKKDEFARITGTIAGGIAGGLFFACADGGSCRSCGAKIACPSGRDKIFEKKSAGDLRCAAFLEMKGKGGGGEPTG